MVGHATNYVCIQTREVLKERYRKIGFLWSVPDILRFREIDPLEARKDMQIITRSLSHCPAEVEADMPGLSSCIIMAGVTIADNIVTLETRFDSNTIILNSNGVPMVPMDPV